MNEFEFFPFTSSKEKHIEGNKCVVKVTNGKREFWNGYVALHSSLLPPEFRDKDVITATQFLNVHGGCDYFSIEGEYLVFGFHTNHSGDEKSRKLEDWTFVMTVTKQLEQQLLEFARRFPEWAGKEFSEQLKIMDEIRNSGKIQCRPSDYALKVVSTAAQAQPDKATNTNSFFNLPGNERETRSTKPAPKNKD